MLQWRNRKLDFASIETPEGELARSRRDDPRLIRSRMVDDVIALENVSRDADDRGARVGAAPPSRLLWDMCQIPDYRKISAASHAELVATLYRFVMSDAGKIPADWFAAPGSACRPHRRRSRHAIQPARADPHLDLRVPPRAMARRSRALAGAHARDRGHAVRRAARASDQALRRSPHRCPDAPLARQRGDRWPRSGPTGSILVENHYVGRLDGFCFTPDASSDGIHGRAARNAAAKILVGELAGRTDALAEGRRQGHHIDPNGRIVWMGSEIATAGTRRERAQAPRADHSRTSIWRAPIASDHQRLEAWLAAHLDARLKPAPPAEPGDGPRRPVARARLSFMRDTRRAPARHGGGRDQVA